MPVDLPEKIDRIKNKLDTPSAWLWLLDISITGVDDTLRFVNNNADVVYDGNIYGKCNFTINQQKSDSAGSLPSVTLNVSNVNLVEYLLPYVEDYEGIVGATIVVTPVNSFHLDIDMSSKAQEYQVKSTSSKEEVIVFTLGAPNPLTQRFPLHRYLGLHCRFMRRFRGVECGYDGIETVCDGTLKRCVELTNETRFGGQPGIRSKTVRFA